MTTHAVNKKATFDYEILQTLEAGLVLHGQEVKSVKTGHISLKGAFVTLKQGGGKIPEAYLTNCHIPAYKHAGKLEGYDPYRARKLLLNKSEIKHLIGKTKEQGLTLVPLKVYNKHKLLKLSFGVARGKKKIDKRESIKKRETERKLRRMQTQY